MYINCVTYSIYKNWLKTGTQNHPLNKQNESAEQKATKTWITNDKRLQSCFQDTEEKN